MKKLIVLTIGIVLVLSMWAQAANISDVEWTALKAKIAQQEAEIAQLKEAIKIIADTAKKDVENRDRFNRGLGDSIVRVKESAEASYLALTKAQDLLAKKQEALGKEQYALAARYDAAIDAAIKEVRRKNKIANVSGTAKIQGLERKTQDDAFSQALTMVGLDKEDRAAIYLYAAYSEEDNVSGFKRCLKTFGNEAKFDQIERAAKQLAKDGYLKLGESQDVRIVRKDPSKPLSEEAKSALQLARESQYRAAERHRINLTPIVMPQRIHSNVVRRNVGKDKEDSDGFYTKVNWSSLLRR